MKTKTLIGIILLVTILALVKIFFLSPKQQQPTTQQKGNAAPVPVRIAIVKSAKVQNALTLAATVLSNEEVDLKPETSGKVIDLFIKEGSNVQRGQLLVKLNDANLQAQLKKMMVQQKLATEKEQRVKQLLAIKGVSQDEYDVALTALNAADADVELIRTQIQETEIRAPFDGVVGLKNISVGSFVSTADVIASVQQLDPLKIDFTVPQRDAAQIRIGDTILLHIEGHSKEYTGKIYAFDPKIEANTRSLKVRALVNNKNHEIFPGSFAQVKLPLQAQNSFVIPSVAVIPDLRGQKTYVIHKGVADLVMIKTGLRTDSTVEVIKGLSAGDTIVTEGILSLKPGSPVKILGAKK